MEVWIQPSKGVESERLWTNENSESSAAAASASAISAKRSTGSAYGGFADAAGGGVGGENAAGESASAEEEEDADSESDEALAEMDLPDLKRRFVLYYLNSHSKLFTKIGYTDKCRMFTFSKVEY